MSTITDLLWRENGPPRRGPKPRLTLGAVVEAAIAIADAEGLAAVSMQRVADHLGATKMALYRYVPGKAELTALMLDAAVGAPPAATGAVSWRAGLSDWAVTLHGCFASRPWSLELAVGARVLGPNELAWYEAGLQHLASTPLRASERLDVLALLSGHVRGIVQQEGSGGDPEHMIGTFMAQVLSAHADEFPATAAAFRDAASTSEQDDALAFGLARILDGLAALMSSRM
ncbi:TetR/AcrR family transcriptional regulator C-terminal domain-containing protein [Humibacter antri]